jgi:arsenite methyltransferase
MLSLAVLRVMLRELTTWECAARVPEPCLIMDAPENVEAYLQAGTIDRVLAPVYLYSAAQVCDVIRPGDLVLDLGCGPATQLGVVARLNPDVRFVGVDASEPMLKAGRAHLLAEGVRNVELRQNDITDLGSVDDRSVDAVMSTLTLHHLPDRDALHATYRAVSRVLKVGGGIYLNDFGRLKSSRSMHYFAHQYADRQSALFTLDYWNSLNAAFSLEDYKSATSLLKSAGKLYTTFLVPYMVAFKSPERQRPSESLRAAFEQLRTELAPHQQTDLNDLTAFFGLGGLRCALL